MIGIPHEIMLIYIHPVALLVQYRAKVNSSYEMLMGKIIHVTLYSVSDNDL